MNLGNSELSLTQMRALDALFLEYERLSAEIRSLQDAQRRMATIVPPALAIGLPLVLIQKTTENAGLLAYILIGLSYVFLFFTSNYIGLTRHILRISVFQLSSITSQVNRLLVSSQCELLDWELFTRANVRKETGEVISYALTQGSELLLVSLPSLCFLLVGLNFYLELNGFTISLALLIGPYIIIGLTSIFVAYKTLIHSKAIPKPRGIAKRQLSPSPRDEA